MLDFSDEALHEKLAEIETIEERLAELAKLTDPASREEAERLADLLEQTEIERDNIVGAWFHED